MLEIKPIQTKVEQEAACARCGIAFDADCMAYAASENGNFLGMCQFNIESGIGYIKNIALCKDVDDFEALFLMGRAALNFIDLCDIHQAICAPNAASPRVIAAVGFKRLDDGRLFADMTHMFGGCGGEGHSTTNS